MIDNHTLKIPKRQLNRNAKSVFKRHLKRKSQIPILITIIYIQKKKYKISFLIYICYISKKSGVLNNNNNLTNII